jgi:hypothetical protein
VPTHCPLSAPFVLYSIYQGQLGGRAINRVLTPDRERELELRRSISTMFVGRTAVLCRVVSIWAVIASIGGTAVGGSDADGLAGGTTVAGKFFPYVGVGTAAKLGEPEILQVSETPMAVFTITVWFILRCIPCIVPKYPRQDEFSDAIHGITRTSLCGARSTPPALPPWPQWV